MKQTKILGVVADAARNQFTEIVNAPDINCLETLSPELDNLDRAASYPVDAIVMYTQSLTDTESEFASGYFHVRKGVAGILITAEERTVDLLDKAMGLGFNKVVGGNASLEAIQQLIIDETAKLTSRDESATVRVYDSKVIAVYSAKGGAGKTTTASNLATALYASGKKVSVLDVDLSYGDIVCTFSIDKGDTIAELSMERNITPALIKSYLRETEAGPLVICAPNSPENVEEITPEILQKIIDTLRTDSDYVIIDCYQNLDVCTKLVLKEADIILFVVYPETPAMRDARTCKVKYLERQELLEKVKIVLNKDGMSSLTSDEVSDFLDLPIFAIIPYDIKSISSSTNRGQPYMSTVSKTAKAFLKPKLQKAYEELTQKVLGL